MSPREPYGDKPMTSAERVKRSRWVNSVENIAFKLMDLIDEAPEQLPRKPEIPAELIKKLNEFVTEFEPPTPEAKLHGPGVLKLGNGNQFRNKKLAMEYIAKYFKGAEVLDKTTIKIPNWGKCHISAYTHKKGAMISTPNRVDPNFGGVPWHNDDYILMFRDIGDGRCMIYINKIEPLFNYRTIGQHGVLWEKIAELADYSEIIDSKEVLQLLNK